MIAYTFTTLQAGLVKSGSKTMTIRAPERKHAMPGETIGLYLGRDRFRGRPRELLRVATCESVMQADIEIVSGVVVNAKLGNTMIDPKELATRDGFKSPEEMGYYFLRWHKKDAVDGDLTFWGTAITWL